MKRVFCVKWLSLLLCLFLLSGMLMACQQTEKNAADAPMMDATQESTSGTAMPNAADKSEIGESLQEETEGAEENFAPKIIRTAELRAETKQFDTALSDIERTVKELGGYVEASSIQGQSYAGSDGNRYAEYTIRVPAEKLDEWMETTGELVHVTHSSATAEDISSEYYDIEARLSVLETERQVLEKMLSQATSVSNMITVEQRLYDVIYEIESYKTMLKVYDSKVAYSTVKMTVSEVTDLTVINEGNTFGSRLKKAFKESWQNFVEFCKDFVVFLIYALPVLLVLAVCACVLIPVICVIRKKRKKKDTSNDD